MTIRWITPLLGTAPASAVLGLSEVQILDVRDMLDKAGNEATIIREKIQLGCDLLVAGKKIVVCCDHGISRSNSVAAGILACFERISLDESVRRVLASTGETEIRLDVIEAIRRATETELSIDRERKCWLLTGGHGYLGSLLASAVPKGVELLRPSRRELDILHGGVALNLYVREHQVTRILHFATPHVGNTNSSVGESLVMLRNILDVCANNHIPLFLPSRWEVFGAYKGQILRADEETPLRPAGVIGDAKYLCEKLVEAWVNRNSVEVTVLRSSLVFGINGAPNFIRSFIKRAVSREVITTHIYKNGPPQLDLIYARDWIQACWSLLLSDKAGVFNVGGGILLSTTEIAELVIESCGCGQKLKRMPIDDIASNVLLDYKKLSETTGWKPSNDVASRLSDFARSFANELDFDKNGKLT